MKVHLDTHLVAWLYEGQIELIPKAVAELLEQNELVISPMVELELQYLHEIGRAETSSDVVVEDLRGRIGLSRSTAPFAAIIDQARRLVWTRDPFDRIIVATSIVEPAPLITRDRHIIDHFENARWDKPARARRRRAKRPSVSRGSR